MDEESEEYYERVIYENEPKAYQLKLVVNEFKGKTYLHIRKYFLSYDGIYTPSSEGISMEANIEGIRALLDGLIEISSYTECVDSFTEYYSKFIQPK